MNRKVKSAIGIGISIVLIWLVFKGTNWSEFIKVIQNINYFILIAAMIILISSVWVRAIRWQILISNVGDVSTKDLYKVTMVGFMGNNILPFKMGELLRAYVISKKQNIIFAGALTSLIVERMLDLISIILIASSIFLIFPITDWARKTAIIGFFIVICFFIFSLFLVKNKSKFEAWYLKKQKQLIEKDKETISRQFVGFCRGIESLWQNPKPWQTVFLSLLIWIMYFIFTILSIYAFNFNFGFLDIMKMGILVISFVTLAVIVPSAPGYIGTYQAATIAALQIVYINIDAARAFAIMYHLAQYVPLTFIGLYYFFKLNLHIADLDKV